MTAYWAGCTSIAHLCAIAIERTLTITNPIWSMANKNTIPPYIYAMTGVCWCWGFIWAVIPLTGEFILHMFCKLDKDS